MAEPFRVMLCANSDTCPYTEAEFRGFFGDEDYLRHWREAIPVKVTAQDFMRMDWHYTSMLEVALQEQKKTRLGRQGGSREAMR